RHQTGEAGPDHEDRLAFSRRRGSGFGTQWRPNGRHGSGRRGAFEKAPAVQCPAQDSPIRAECLIHYPPSLSFARAVLHLAPRKESFVEKRLPRTLALALCACVLLLASGA